MIKKQTTSKATTQDEKQVQAFFAKGGYNFLKQFENDFDCAGICDVPLFYVTKDISEGPPK